MRALDVDYMLGLVPILLGYLPLTLFMAVVGMVFALVLAALMAVERVARIPVLDVFVRLFISFFRGTPLLVQLFLFYFGLPQIVPPMSGIDGVTAAIIANLARRIDQSELDSLPRSV